MSTPKPAENLSVDDLKKHPVWEWVLDTEPERDDLLQPVVELPVASLANRLVGTQVTLNNGTSHWAVLLNVSTASARQTRHFMTLWLEANGDWFELARYFDSEYRTRGPSQLAQFLGLGIDEVFPIFYDISRVATGHQDVLAGSIPARPEKELTEDELIDLSLEE